MWYETLGTVQLDWNALQDYFQQQYSKFGNTREQYFHACRSFQYDENTDTIDSYIHKVKQVAALINCGEPQILELFKNTLHSKIYYMLYHINDLRKAIEVTKRRQTKEKIDKQKSGQALVSPFMKINQQNPKRSDKNVSFSAMETIQKQGDSIDKLTSLMNELSTKLDRRENSAQYDPKFIKEEIEDADKGRIGMDLETGPIVGNKVGIMVTEAGEVIRIVITIVEGIIDIEITIMGNIRLTIGTMIDLVTEGKISIKIMVKGIETEV